MSTKDVVVALADKHFLTQAKQLFSTVYWNSGWSGDLLLMAYDTDDSELEWFTRRGIKIMHCSQLDCGSDKKGDIITACKCYLFSEYFTQWDNVIYMDVDIVTRGSLDGLTNLQGFSACFSQGQTIRDNIEQRLGTLSSEQKDLLRSYDLERKAFNSGVMAFPTSIIHPNMFEDALSTFRKFVKLGFFGGDQFPLNMFFYDRWLELPLAFNQIVQLDSDTYNPSKLSGIIIHCVSFGNGPWHEDSIFYSEWKQNLDKADGIDTRSPQTVASISDEDLLKRSQLVSRAYLMGGTLNLKTLMRFVARLFSLLMSNPGKFWKKLSMARTR